MEYDRQQSQEGQVSSDKNMRFGIVGISMLFRIDFNCTKNGKRGLGGGGGAVLLPVRTSGSILDGRGWGGGVICRHHREEVAAQ